MSLIKNEEEIASYLKEKIKAKGLSQSDLARKISEEMGDGYDNNSLRDLVSKWCNAKRKPGVDYIYFLAKVLGVSIEEILVAGEVCGKYDNRQFTLYAIAKSGNVEQIENLMKKENVGINYDEFDKTILDYIIEFERMDLLKYLVDKNHLSFELNHINSSIRIGNGIENADKYIELMRLLVKEDELNIFRIAISRAYPILKQRFSRVDEKRYSNLPMIDGALYRMVDYQYGYEFPDDIIIKLIDTKNILDYLIMPFVPAPAEWDSFNTGVWYINKDKNKIEGIENIEFLSASFNHILDVAIKVGKFDIANKMLILGIEHNKKAKQEIESFGYRREDINISKNGVASLGKNGMGQINIFCVVQEEAKKLLPNKFEKLLGQLNDLEER